MIRKSFRPMVVGVVPLAALLSVNCGIFLAPVIVPKALVLNAQKIAFSASIVDEAGKPLSHVTVDVTRFKEAIDVFGEAENSAVVPPKIVDGEFDYSSLHNFALQVVFSKEGYTRETRGVANKDTVPSFGWFPGGPYGELVNVSKNPRFVVVMHPKPADDKQAD